MPAIINDVFTLKDEESPEKIENLEELNVATTAFDVQWTASISDDVIGYKVSISTFGDSESVTATTTNTTYSFAELLPDTPYSVSVVAFDASGNESMPAIINDVFTLADTEKPSVVINLQASNETATSFKVSWTASTDNVGVTGYKVFIDEVAGDFEYETTTTDIFYSFTELLPLTFYRVTVVAIDAAGNRSEASDTLTATPSDTEPPTNVMNLVSLNVTATAFDVEWDASDDNVGVTGYKVSIHGVSVVFDYETTTPNLFTPFTGLLPNTAYKVSVVALDAALNESSTAAEIFLITPPDAESLIAVIVANSNYPADGIPSETDLTDVGTTDVIPNNVNDYEEAIANSVPAPVTLVDLQEIINAVNLSNEALNEILEDSASPGGANNANETSVLLAQFLSIINTTIVPTGNKSTYQAAISAKANFPGLTGVNPANESAYQAAIATKADFSNLPTFAQVQAVIDTVNAAAGDCNCLQISIQVQD